MNEVGPEEMLGYWAFFRSQLLFGWWWIPAVVTGGIINWREGRLGLVLLLLPFVLLGVSWWEWRKIRASVAIFATAAGNGWAAAKCG